MPDATKDLDYYAANPDEMPADPDAFGELMAKLEGAAPKDEQEAPTEQSNESADDGAESEPDVTKDAEKPVEDEQEKEAPIASKDGKHEIPYSVLQTERERRRAAEQAMKGLQDRIAALEQKPADKGGDAPLEHEDEDLAKMAEDFPAVAKLLAQTKRLDAQLQTVAKRLEQEDAQKAETEVAQVRAAVDGNPVLLHWETNDPDRWAAAIEADQKLQASPLHKGLTLEQRLAKAVEVVEAFYGPDATAPVASPSPAARPAEPAAAVKTVTAPRTLSDIPGGGVTQANPLEEFASMSAARLGAQMAGMTPDQINTLLARLG